MKILEINKISVSIVGLNVEFNSDPLKVFYTLPGSIRAGKTNLKKYLFPAKYDIGEFFEYLENLPKKSVSYCLDESACPIVMSRTFRFKTYKSGTGKQIPDFKNYELRGISHKSFDKVKRIY